VILYLSPDSVGAMRRIKIIDTKINPGHDTHGPTRLTDARFRHSKNRIIEVLRTQDIPAMSDKPHNFEWPQYVIDRVMAKRGRGDPVISTA